MLNLWFPWPATTLGPQPGQMATCQAPSAQACGARGLGRCCPSKYLGTNQIITLHTLQLHDLYVNYISKLQKIPKGRPHKEAVFKRVS